MARSLVIVESPAKAKTINKYLGREYTVKASLGHVLDLPKKTLGILLPGTENGKKKKKKRKTKAKAKGGEKLAEEKKLPKPVVVTAENIFEPTLEVIPGKVKVIADLRKAAENAPNVYLATDPDREGEAISQHLLDTLAIKKSDRAKYRRVMFNEITPRPSRPHCRAGDVNGDLVDAQQARRVLDRLVGYKISPIL
jgi:DNA topoisomerase-1